MNLVTFLHHLWPLATSHIRYSHSERRGEIAAAEKDDRQENMMREDQGGGGGGGPQEESGINHRVIVDTSSDDTKRRRRIRWICGLIVFLAALGLIVGLVYHYKVRPQGGNRRQ